MAKSSGGLLGDPWPALPPSSHTFFAAERVTSMLLQAGQRQKDVDIHKHPAWRRQQTQCSFKFEFS